MCTSLVAQKTNIARIKGRLSNFGSIAELQDFSETQYMAPSSFIQRIELYKDSMIDIEVPLKRPTYFRLGRNKLYLSPGDNIEIFIDDVNSANATFKGKGSVANNYLRNTPFPKGGSFVEAGKNIQPTAREMLAFILNKAKERNNLLASLKGVSAEFVRLELARNKADIIKSILAVPGYGSYFFRNEPKPFWESYLTEFIKIADPVKDSLFKNFVDPAFLQIEVYRDLDQYFDLSKATPSAAQIIRDWQKANDIARGTIKPLNDKSKIPALKLVVDSIKTKKYRDVLNLLLAEKMKFGVGDTAIDFTVINPDKTTTTLSSLKGKVIYIDIWATWCGPCMAEMPHLEELKEKYKSQNGLAIVSLSVDDNDPIWLKNLEKRKPDGIQWRIDRAKLMQYEVESIPRYILIDKDFKVREMNAMKAADPLLSKLIDDLLSR